MGFVLLGALLVLALATAKPEPVRYRPDYWPTSWPAPPAEFLTAVVAAAKQYKVKMADLVALAFVESRFDPRAVGRVCPKTWEKIRERKIDPSRPDRWRDHYTLNDCRAIGIMGLMPFNFIGVPGGLPLGAPVTDGFNVTLNVAMAARLLQQQYNRTGDWVSAYHAYNPGGGEEYYERFRRARTVFNTAATHVS